MKKQHNSLNKWLIDFFTTWKLVSQPLCIFSICKHLFDIPHCCPSALVLFLHVPLQVEPSLECFQAYFAHNIVFNHIRFRFFEVCIQNRALSFLFGGMNCPNMFFQIIISSEFFFTLIADEFVRSVVCAFVPLKVIPSLK